VHSVFLSPSGRLRSGWRCVVALVLSAIALFLAVNLGAAFYPNLGSRFELLNCTLSALLLLVLYIILLRTFDHEPHPIASLGLAFNRKTALQIVAGAVLGAAMVTAAVFWIGARGGLSFQFTWSNATWRPFLITFFTLVAAAMTEELLFRGYTFQRLLEGLPAAVAVVISSALFALIHWSNPYIVRFALLNTALIGVLLALAYLRTRSLWFCWAIHFSWNFFLGVVFGLPVSGTTQFAVVTTGQARGPAWLTGGDYGIEAAVSASVAIAVGALLLLLLTRGTWLRNPQAETGVEPATAAARPR